MSDSGSYDALSSGDDDEDVEVGAGDVPVVAAKGASSSSSSSSGSAAATVGMAGSPGEHYYKALRGAMDSLAAPVGFFASGYAEEFDRLQRETEPQPGDIAVQSTEAQKKNRYFDVLPLEATRVRLPVHTEPGAKAKEGADYINASYIVDPLLHPALPGGGGGSGGGSGGGGGGGGPPDPFAPSSSSGGGGHGAAGIATGLAFSAAAPASYIAAQAPLPVGIGDWWRMVASEKVRVILMLTGCQEGAVVKAHAYWPMAVGAEGRIRIDAGLSVVMEAEEEGAPCPSCIRRRIVLECSPRQDAVGGAGGGDSSSTSGSSSSSSSSGEGKDQRQQGPTKHVVHLLQYVAWPDRQALEAKDFGQIELLLKEAARLEAGTEVDRKANRGGAGGGGALAPPVLVHCSAGVGRTGAVITIDVITQALARMMSVGGGGGGGGGGGSSVLADAACAGAGASFAAGGSGVPLDPTDVYSVSKALRSQRAGLIMTQTQYEMAYRYAKWWLEERSSGCGGGSGGR